MSEQLKETAHDGTEQEEENAAVETDHLDDMDDGCGCAEVWEHLSENRDGEATADD